MSRDFDSSYDPKLVDHADAEFVCSRIGIYCRNESLLRFLYNPVQGRLEMVSEWNVYDQVSDILIYNLKTVLGYIGFVKVTLNLRTIFPFRISLLGITPYTTI